MVTTLAPPPGDVPQSRMNFLAKIVPSPVVLLDDLIIADDLDLITTNPDYLEYCSAAQPAVVH